MFFIFFLFNCLTYFVLLKNKQLMIKPYMQLIDFYYSKIKIKIKKQSLQFNLFSIKPIHSKMISASNRNNNNQGQQRQMLGRFQIDPLMYLYVPILICTPLYTYYMAVSHKQQKPFPWTTVTDTATHYPQDIVFRYTMLIASSIISLTFFVIFRWLENQCIRVGHKTLSIWYFYVTQFSMLCYSITIGTIDQKGIGNLHGPCAVIFFIIWVVVIQRITTFTAEVRRWDATVISGKSLILKKLLAFYVLGVWIYCIVGLLTTPNEQLQKKSDMYVVIVEWNSVLINLLWVLTFVMQWKQFNFCLDFYPKSQAKLSESTNNSIQHYQIQDNQIRNYYGCDPQIKQAIYKEITLDQIRQIKKQNNKF